MAGTKELFKQYQELQLQIKKGEAKLDGFRGEMEVLAAGLGAQHREISALEIKLGEELSKKTNAQKESLAEAETAIAQGNLEGAYNCLYPEPAPTDEALGIIFADGPYLEYFALKENSRFTLKKLEKFVTILFSDERDVYFGNVSHFSPISQIKSLFGMPSYKRPSSIFAFARHKGKLIDSGDYGICDTLNGNCLMERGELENRKISKILSLSAFGNSLYALTRNPYRYHHFVSLKDRGGKYEVEETLFDYSHTHSYFCNAVTVPIPSQINKKQYPFSVLGCVHLDFFDINGVVKIEGARINSNYINKLALLSCSGNEAEIIYSGCELGSIAKARIDFENKRILDSQVVTKLAEDDFIALDVVRSTELHEKLLKIGK